MEYKVESSLDRFEAWSGGKDTLDVLIEKGDCDSVEQLIEEMETLGTDTAINDFLWFERDFIAQYLGYEDWDEKCQLALTCIGNRMTIPNWFRNEIEDCVEEWCDEHEVCYDEVEWEDAAEEIVLWAE